MSVDKVDAEEVREGLRAAQLFSGKAGSGPAQSGPHRRSPSTSSLPVDAADWCRPVVGNESAASLIGSDSALLVRDKPPLPRGRLGSLGRRKKKSLGMDADEQLSRTGSSKRKGSVFRDALNFFKSR